MRLLVVVAFAAVLACVQAQYPTCPAGSAQGVPCTPTPDGSVYPCQICDEPVRAFRCSPFPTGGAFLFPATNLNPCSDSGVSDTCPEELAQMAPGQPCDSSQTDFCAIIKCIAQSDAADEGVRQCVCEHDESSGSDKWNCAADVLCDECPAGGFLGDISGEQCRYRNDDTFDTCQGGCDVGLSPWTCTCNFANPDDAIGTWACFEEDCADFDPNPVYNLIGPGDCFSGHIRNIFHTVDADTGKGELLGAFRLNSSTVNQYDPFNGVLNAHIEVFRRQDFEEQIGIGTITSSDLFPTGVDNLVAGTLSIAVELFPGEAMGTHAAIMGSLSHTVNIPGVALLGDSIEGPNTWRSNDFPFLLTLYGEDGTWSAGAFSGSTFGLSIRFEAARTCSSNLDCPVANAECLLGTCNGPGECNYQCRPSTTACLVAPGVPGFCEGNGVSSCGCET